MNYDSYNLAKFSRCKSIPLILTIAYISATVLLSVLGPVRYRNGEYKYWITIAFIVGVLFFLCMGYYLGLHTVAAVPFADSGKALYRKEKFLRTCLYISLISIVLELIYLKSIGHFSLNVGDVGALYSDRIESFANPVILFRFLAAPCRVASFALGIYCFTNVSTKYKALIIINAALYLMIFLFGYGGQKGISDIVIYFVLALFVNRMKDGGRLSKKTALIITVILLAAFFLFSYMQYMRYAPRGINASNYHLYSSGEFYYDTEHILFKVFGENLGFGMATILNGYMSQGYYGLSLCLQLPFKWTYGIGNSYMLTGLLERFGISGIFEQTYMYRMQLAFGRNATAAWNTIFPWLASDFTWIGAMLFFLLIGYVMAKSWKEVILYNNVISYLMLATIMILVLFIPANNQLFHGYDAFISTWVIILLWIFTRRGYSYE